MLIVRKSMFCLCLNMSRIWSIWECAKHAATATLRERGREGPVVCKSPTGRMMTGRHAQCWPKLRFVISYEIYSILINQIEIWLTEPSLFASMHRWWHVSIYSWLHGYTTTGLSMLYKGFNMLFVKFLWFLYFLDVYKLTNVENIFWQLNSTKFTFFLYPM